MPLSRARVPGAIALGVGVLLGWGLAQAPSKLVRAHASDRSGESVLMSGPIQVRYNEGAKVQIPQDALYYLDYKAGKLLAAIPMFRQSLGTTKLIDTFVERDLVADFKLELDNGARPHFLMTTGSLGSYSDGCALLYVFESTTSQVAVYKVQPQTVGLVSKPRFELVEVRTIANPAASAPTR